MNLLQALKGKHQPHSMRPLGECDACVALHLLEGSRDALLELQEMSSKNQWDPQRVAEVVRRGLGT